MITAKIFALKNILEDRESNSRLYDLDSRNFSTHVRRIVIFKPLFCFVSCNTTTIKFPVIESFSADGILEPNFNKFTLLSLLISCFSPLGILLL
jgi:hypothetical protein